MALSNQIDFRFDHRRDEMIDLVCFLTELGKTAKAQSRPDDVAGDFVVNWVGGCSKYANVIQPRLVLLGRNQTYGTISFCHGALEAYPTKFVQLF